VTAGNSSGLNDGACAMIIASEAAARANGLLYDTSYDPAYLDTECAIDLPQTLWQPQMVQGLWEIPVGAFQDYPGHLRHLQLSACSLGEIRHAILEAHRLGWTHLVLVMHSFELIQRRHLQGLEPRVDRLMLRRFEGLCQFLAANRSLVETGHFSHIDPAALAGRQPSGPLVSHPGRALWRLGQQAWRRLDSRA
jgi:hypothetical protein